MQEFLLWFLGSPRSESPSPPRNLSAGQEGGGGEERDGRGGKKRWEWEEGVGGGRREGGGREEGGRRERGGGRREGGGGKEEKEKEREEEVRKEVGDKIVAVTEQQFAR